MTYYIISLLGIFSSFVLKVRRRLKIFVHLGKHNILNGIWCCCSLTSYCFNPRREKWITSSYLCFAPAFTTSCCSLSIVCKICQPLIDAISNLSSCSFVRIKCWCSSTDIFYADIFSSISCNNLPHTTPLVRMGVHKRFAVKSTRSRDYDKIVWYATKTS